LPPERRRVVLDEDIKWKLMYELQGRGRADATSLKALGIDKKVDGALIKRVTDGTYDPFVLVTYDNKMATVHAAEIAHHKPTLAIVDEASFKRSGRPEGETEAYIRDVVHRWLHRIEIMRAADIRHYSAARHWAIWICLPQVVDKPARAQGPGGGT